MIRNGASGRWIVWGVILVLYQVSIHQAIGMPNGAWAGALLAVAPFVSASLALAWQASRRATALLLWGFGWFCAWLLRAALARHFGWGLYLEHACFNLALAGLFGRTLMPGQTPLCTRLATRVHGALDNSALRYTRRVTAAWSGFFVVIAALSTLLFFGASLSAWSVFANFLMLPLVASGFLCERICRGIALPEMAHSSILDAIRAYQNDRDEADLKNRENASAPRHHDRHA
jgi:uncharacterized membrane protein